MKKINSFTQKVKWIPFILCLALLLPVKAQNDFEIAKNVDIFISVMRELNAKYADEITPGDLTKTAIDAMLASLDPYTNYYPETQIEDVKMLTAGQYGGIGALIQQRDKNTIISELYKDRPAQKAGLLPGDVILKIDGKSAEGKTSSDVSVILKGQPGSTLNMEIFRPTRNKKFSFNIKREEIKLPNIPYHGMIDNRIGYIKLDQFTERAGDEVKEAFLDLKKQGMSGLILDLRNNGGGLLQEAVKIMNIFVDQNVTIVTTRGKIAEQNNTFKTRMPAIDKEIPVVVLINEFSASASEIVSGAFQDLDRAVIVGKKSFGKGLVQNIVPLSYHATMKITVSKYYIPSGRCVQKIDYFNRDTLLPSAPVPDSIAGIFKTENGRTVYDKGGIEPDVITPDTIASDILLALVLNNLVFDYANEYADKHDLIPSAGEFTVDDALYQDFVNYLKNKNYDYTTETEETLKDLKKSAEADNYFKDIESYYNKMTEQVKRNKAADLQTYKKEISEYLSAEIVSRYYYQEGRICNRLSGDPDVKTATEILKDTSRYKSILNIK